MKAFSRALERRQVLNCVDFDNGISIFIVAKNLDDARKIPMKVQDASNDVKLKVRLENDENLNVHVKNESRCFKIFLREIALQQLHSSGIVQLGEEFVDTTTLEKVKGEADCCSISIRAEYYQKHWTIEFVLFPKVFRYKYFMAHEDRVKGFSLPKNQMIEDDIESRRVIIPPHMENGIIVETLKEFPPPTALDRSNFEYGMGLHVHLNEQECCHFWSEVHGLKAFCFDGKDGIAFPFKFCRIALENENILLTKSITEVLPMGCVFSTWVRMARREQARALVIVGKLVKCLTSSSFWNFELRCVEVPTMKDSALPLDHGHIRLSLDCNSKVTLKDYGTNVSKPFTSARGILTGDLQIKPTGKTLESEQGRDGDFKREPLSLSRYVKQQEQRMENFSPCPSSHQIEDSVLPSKKNGSPKKYVLGNFKTKSRTSHKMPKSTGRNKEKPARTSAKTQLKPTNGKRKTQTKSSKARSNSRTKNSRVSSADDEQGRNGRSNAMNGKFNSQESVGLPSKRKTVKSHKREQATSPNTCRQQIQKIYSKFCPSKLKDVDKLMEKYKGSEATLLQTIKKKYNHQNDLDANSPSSQKSILLSQRSSSTVSSLSQSQPSSASTVEDRTDTEDHAVKTTSSQNSIKTSKRIQIHSQRDDVFYSKEIRQVHERSPSKEREQLLLKSIGKKHRGALQTSHDMSSPSGKEDLSNKDHQLHHGERADAKILERLQQQKNEECQAELKKLEDNAGVKRVLTEERGRIEEARNIARETASCGEKAACQPNEKESNVHQKEVYRGFDGYHIWRMPGSYFEILDG